MNQSPGLGHSRALSYTALALTLPRAYRTQERYLLRQLKLVHSGLEPAKSWPLTLSGVYTSFTVSLLTHHIRLLVGFC